MDHVEILNAANEARPDLVEKTAQALSILDKLAPEFVPEVISDFNEITGVTQEKIASAGSANMKGFALGAAGLAVSGLGAAVASDLYDAAKRGLSKGSNFRRIIAANPDLLEKNQNQDVVKAFNTLHRFAPEFTSDPNLGGQLLSAMTQIPENQVGIIKDMITARKNLRDTKTKQFGPGPLELHQIRPHKGEG